MWLEPSDDITVLISLQVGLFCCDLINKFYNNYDANTMDETQIYSICSNSSLGDY